MSQIHAFDVLLGRGGATNSNNGNVVFRGIVASRQMEYLAAKKKEKKTIALECVNEMKKKGGRFLKRDDASGSWVEVPIAAATKKASQALRENLDVKHKRVRETKGSPAVLDPQKRAKKQKIVSGTVASPALVSLAGEENAVPELNEEQSSPVNFYKGPPVSSDDCDNVSEV